MANAGILNVGYIESLPARAKYPVVASIEKSHQGRANAASRPGTGIVSTSLPQQR